MNILTKSSASKNIYATKNVWNRGLEYFHKLPRLNINIIHFNNCVSIYWMIRWLKTITTALKYILILQVFRQVFPLLFRSRTKERHIFSWRQFLQCHWNMDSEEADTDNVPSGYFKSYDDFEVIKICFKIIKLKILSNLKFFVA